MRVIDPLEVLSASPLLALVGLVLIVAILLAPAALSVAGLSGSQIVKLLTETMRFIRDTIRAFRCGDRE